MDGLACQKQQKNDNDKNENSNGDDDVALVTTDAATSAAAVANDDDVPDFEPPNPWTIAILIQGVTSGLWQEISS